MQVQAITKNVRMSAQKMREVVRQIQGLAGDASAGGPRGRAAQIRPSGGQDFEVGHRQRGKQQQWPSRRTCGCKEAVAGTATTFKRFHAQSARFGWPDPQAQLPYQNCRSQTR